MSLPLELDLALFLSFLVFLFLDLSSSESLEELLDLFLEGLNRINFFVELKFAKVGYLSSSLEESESEDSCLDFFSFLEERIDRPDLVRFLLLPESLD